MYLTMDNVDSGPYHPCSMTTTVVTNCKIKWEVAVNEKFNDIEFFSDTLHSFWAAQKSTTVQSLTLWPMATPP